MGNNSAFLYTRKKDEVLDPEYWRSLFMRILSFMSLMASGIPLLVFESNQIGWIECSLFFSSFLHLIGFPKNRSERVAGVHFCLNFFVSSGLQMYWRTSEYGSKYNPINSANWVSVLPFITCFIFPNDEHLRNLVIFLCVAIVSASGIHWISIISNVILCLSLGFISSNFLFHLDTITQFYAQLINKNKEEDSTNYKFIIQITHEIRNPLNVLCGSLCLLEETPNINHHYLDLSKRTTEQLRAFADNISVFQNLDAKSVQEAVQASPSSSVLHSQKESEFFSLQQKQQIQVAALVYSLVKEQSSLAQMLGINMDVSIDEECPMVINSHLKQLQHVLRVLLLNSMKFGGLSESRPNRICLTVRKKSRGDFIAFKLIRNEYFHRRLPSECDEDDCQNNLASSTWSARKEEALNRGIELNGYESECNEEGGLQKDCSLSKESSDSSLHNFHATLEKSNDNGDSLMSLWICEKIASIMGGKLKTSDNWVEFCIPYTLPPQSGKTQSESTLKHSLSEQSASHGNCFRCLVVDDNQLNILICKALLNKINKKKYKDMKILIDEARNGIQAIEKWRNSKYDLILMDLSMPEMDGYESSKFIRIYDNLTYIACVTGHTADSESQKVLTVMDEFIPKPISEDTLSSLIYRCLTRKVRRKSEPS